MRSLTLKMLDDAAACLPQRRKFERRFGTSVGITIKLCTEVANLFEFQWAANCLLSPKQRDFYIKQLATTTYRNAYYYYMSTMPHSLLEKKAHRALGVLRAIAFAKAYNRPRK